jgi:hypothetical protein
MGSIHLSLELKQAILFYLPEKRTLLPYNIATAARINAIHIPDF